MSLIVSNQQQKIQILPQWEADLQGLVDVCLDLEEIDANAEVSLMFVDDLEIQKLNNTYRGKDVPTDVLSFPMYDELDEMQDEEEILLGDIVISLETALRQAEEFNHSIERELSYLMVHGLLHLCGYDHLEEADKKIMRTREEEVLKHRGLNI